MKSTHLELFRSLNEQPDATVMLEKKLLVLCTPRCGSTLWAEALNSSGRLGVCEEWMNYDYFKAWSKITGQEFDLKNYLLWIALKTTRDTGVLCLKWHIGQLIAMNDDHKIGIESLGFDHVVYLYRRDKIAQAVSLCKAVTSNQYRSYEEQKATPLVTRHGIASSLEIIVKYDRFMHKHLWKYVDASYAYEDFQQLSTPQTREHESYNATLKLFGKKPWQDFQAGRLKKQGGTASKLAARDFRRYILGEIT